MCLPDTACTFDKVCLLENVSLGNCLLKNLQSSLPVKLHVEMTHTLRFTLSMWIQDTPRYLLYYGRAVLSINQANTVNIERTKGPPCQATESGHFSADTHTSTIKPLFEIAIFFSSVKRGFPECVFLGLGLVEGFPLLDFSARPTDCRESSYMTPLFFPFPSATYRSSLRFL